MTYRDRACRHCGAVFSPVTSRMKHCSWQCRLLEVVSKFAGVDGCWNWPFSIGSSGYGQMAVNGRPATVHRLSLELFLGEPIPSGMVVMHSCDNRKCFNPAHLSIGTYADNVADMWLKGRQQSYTGHPSGKDHHFAKAPEKHYRKYSDEDLKAMAKVAETATRRKVAESFACSHSIVNRAVQLFGSSQGSRANQQALLERVTK